MEEQRPPGTVERVRGLGRATGEALQQTGYALVGLTALVGERVKEFVEDPQGSSEVVRKRITTLVDRGRETWPTVVEEGREVAEEVAETARTRVQEKARWKTGGTVGEPATEEATREEEPEARWGRDPGGGPEASEEEDEVAGPESPPDYEELTVSELEEIARDRDLEGRSQMNQAELIEALREDDRGAEGAGQEG